MMHKTPDTTPNVTPPPTSSPTPPPTSSPTPPPTQTCPPGTTGTPPFCNTGGNNNNNVKIINNNIVRQDGRVIIQDLAGVLVATPSCNAITNTLSLGPSTMLKDGMRVIAVLAPCHLLDGTVLLNLPTSGIHLVVAHVAGGEVLSSIAVKKKMVSNLGGGKALYSVDLNEVMSGITPKAGTQATLNNNINAILLWNNAGQNVNFNADNTLAMNIISQR